MSCGQVEVAVAEAIKELPGDSVTTPGCSPRLVQGLKRCGPRRLYPRRTTLIRTASGPSVGSRAAPESRPDPQSAQEALPRLLRIVCARRFCDQHEMSLHTATGRSLP